MQLYSDWVVYDSIVVFQYDWLIAVTDSKMIIEFWEIPVREYPILP